MFPYVFALLYILASLGVAYLGRGTRAGWFGSFVLALIVTPLVAVVAVVGFMRVSPRHQS